MQGLQNLARPHVHLRPQGRRNFFVESLAHESVSEAVVSHRARYFGDDTHLLRFVEQPEQALARKLDQILERGEREFTPQERRRAEHAVAIGREGRKTPPDGFANPLRQAPL